MPVPQNKPVYLPKVGDTITVELPDERTRATIEQVISPTSCLAKICTFTSNTGKSHDYRKGDLIGCMYDDLAMNQKGWRAVSQREMDAAAAAQEDADEAAEVAAEAEVDHEPPLPASKPVRGKKKVREMTAGDL